MISPTWRSSSSPVARSLPGRLWLAVPAFLTMRDNKRQSPVTIHLYDALKAAVKQKRSASIRIKLMQLMTG